MKKFNVFLTLLQLFLRAMMILSAAFVFLIKLVILLLGIALAYLLSTLVLIYFPVNRAFINAKEGVIIYLTSDGIHTDFVFPIKNEIVNWQEVFDLNDFASSLNENAFLQVGWGDKGFFLDIPTWKDLTAEVAIKAMCIPSQSLIHVKEVSCIPNNNKYFQSLVLTEDKYLDLTRYIMSHISTIDDQPLVLKNKGYTEDDNFYYSDAKYHAFNTCNAWISNALAFSGIRTCLWSPSAKGIFYQLKKV